MGAAREAGRTDYARDMTAQVEEDVQQVVREGRVFRWKTSGAVWMLVEGQDRNKSGRITWKLVETEGR